MVQTSVNWCTKSCSCHYAAVINLKRLTQSITRDSASSVAPSTAGLYSAKITMQPLKDLWNTGSIAPSTEVTLEFQCFVDGSYLHYWETGHDDYSNASKTIEPPEQGAESTV